MGQSNDGLLAGVKVLEFGQFFAGPTASRMMADMGAEVVKVEFGPYGDYLRGYAPGRAGSAGSSCWRIAARKASALMSPGNWPPAPTC